MITIILINQKQAVIYNTLEFFVKKLFNDYNLQFIESNFFYYTLNSLSFFVLMVILFYVFNIKFRYLKLKLLESAVSFFYRKISKVILTSFSILIKKSNKKEGFTKLNKNEPVLHKRKSNFLNINNPKPRKQNTEFDNYYYKLPSIEFFSQAVIKKNQTKETQKLNLQVSSKLENTLLEYGVEEKL